MRTTPTRGRTARLALPLCAALAAPGLRPAWAQQAADAIVLPTVEVGGARGEAAGGVATGFAAERSQAGTKTSTPLIETPQAVTVVTADRLVTLNARSIAEAVRYSAGVTDYGSRDDPRGYGGSIRGFAPDIYLDGLRLPFAAASQSFDIEPSGLERLEILRGASSPLYGSGQLGGIINAVSKVPRPGQANEVSVQGGSFGRIQGTADVGAVLTEDGSLAVRLNGLVRQSGTQFDNILNNRIYVAPSLRWTHDRTTVTLLASYTQIDGGSTAQFLPASGTVLYNPNGRIARNLLNSDKNFDVYSKRQVAVGYQVEHQVNPNWTLRQNMRYAHIDLTYRYVTAVAFLADNRTLTRQALLQSSNFNNVSLDNQSELRFATGPLSHTLLTGLDFSSQFGALRRGQGTAPSLDVYNPVYRPITSPAYAGNTNTNQTLTQTGFYAQDQVAWGPVKLTLTGRQDFVASQLNNNNLRTNSLTSSNPEHFTYRTALLYASPIGVSPYVAYSTSFQPLTGVDRLNSPFVPQTGTQIEVGAKYQPPGSSLLLTAAAYDLTQQNVLTPDPVSTGFSVQTGEVRTRGIELEAAGDIGHGIKVLAALTYQEPLVTRSNTVGEAGSRPVAIPSHLASLYVDKTWTVDDRLSFALGGGVRYTGSSAGFVPNTFTVPSTTVFDLTARVELQRWRLQLNGTNITDRTIIAACTRSVACSYGTGRAVFATLGYRW